MTPSPVVIIGAGGKTGRRVNALLQARGVATRAVSRSTAVAFDWTKPEGWAAALSGASKAYVTFQPDIAVAGSSAAIAELSRIARHNGLERVVLLSGRGEPGAQAAEAVLQTSGVPWTIVRASFFNQNFSEGFLLDSVLADEIAVPAGPVPEPFIDVDDIAEVVVAALTDGRHASKVYEVTGPRALTFAEAAAEISAAVGRPIRFTQPTPDEFAAAMRPYVPQDIITLLLDLFTVVLDGRNVQVMNGVEQALGRPARDFSDYVRRTVASGVWSA